MKLFLKKAGLLLLLFVFFAAACLSSTIEVQAASQPEFTKKTITIVKGKTKKIKVLNAKRRVKWSTTNKKIAYVRKKNGKKKQIAVIKAGKKTGTCYIKAKIGKKTIKCKVTVKKARKPAIDKEFIDGISEFSFRLFKQTAGSETDPDTNILISPDSVVTALGVTKNGASGKTLDEMEKALGGIASGKFNKNLSKLNKKLSGSNGFIYSVSNSIWARENLVKPLPSFLNINKKYYKSDYYCVPFNNETVTDINNWVYKKTRKMIKQIIRNSDLNKDTRMIIINTIAFEGEWQKQFDKNRSTRMTFTSKRGTAGKTLMLRDTDHYEYFKVNKGKAFVKYYKYGNKGGGIAFVGILPPKDVSIEKYVASLDGKAFISSWNKRTLKRIDLALPEFSYDYSTELTGSLKALGIKKAFTNSADFSKMAERTPETPALKISKVLHKTHIELDANGTKAAAATAVMMEKAGVAIGQEPIKMFFNRPFVYALVDADTGIPLFIGQVNKIR